MHAFSDFSGVQSWEEGSTEDWDNQMEPLGVPEESLTGSSEKKDIKTVLDKMKWVNMKVTQASRQFSGITALNLVTVQILIFSFVFFFFTKEKIIGNIHKFLALYY